MAEKPPRIHNINKPIPVGPEEEREENIRRGDVPQDVYDAGNDAMMELVKALKEKGCSARYIWYVYPGDGAVDYEVTVFLKDRTEGEIREIFSYVTTYFHPMLSYFISTGFKVPGMTIEEAIEDHYLFLGDIGLAILGAHYQEPSNLAANIEASLTNYEGLMRNLRQDPVEVFVRMFWSPTGKPPTREDYSNGIIDRDKTWYEE